MWMIKIRVKHMCVMDVMKIYVYHGPIRHQDECRTTDDYKYRNRYQSRSKSKEEKDRNEKRYRSHSSHSSYSNYSSYSRRRSHSSRYKNNTSSIVKDQSSYRRRSKSSSPINKYARERKADNYKNQSLSRSPLRSTFRSSSKNDPDKSCKRNNRVPSECPAQNSPMNFPPYPVYNNCSFPAPSQMFRGQAPPMIWPIGPRFLPIVYPPFPLRMIGWRMPPPRFNNNSNRGAHHPR